VRKPRVKRPAKSPQELLQRKLRGLRSKRAGANFESWIASAARTAGHDIVRIPDGCKSIGKRLIRFKAPFDFILSTKLGIVFFDAKHTSDDSIRLGAIRPHQVESLKKLLHAPNVKTGFIVLFTQTNTVEFFDLKELLEKDVKYMHSGAGYRLGQLGKLLSFPFYFHNA
jgi:hypothetical protein